MKESEVWDYLLENCTDLDEDIVFKSHEANGEGDGKQSEFVHGDLYESIDIEGKHERNN
jgi:hypothetical protein